MKHLCVLANWKLREKGEEQQLRILNQLIQDESAQLVEKRIQTRRVRSEL